MAFRLLTHRFKPSFFNVAKPVSTINVLYSRSLSSAGPVQAQQPPKVLITGNAKWQIKQKVLILQKTSFAYRHERPSEPRKDILISYFFKVRFKARLRLVDLTISIKSRTLKFSRSL